MYYYIARGLENRFSAQYSNAKMNTTKSIQNTTAHQLHALEWFLCL